MHTVLDIRSLTKSFRAGVPGCSATITAIRRVSLRVNAGERVAVCGPAGVGKTTLLLCAAGLLRADDDVGEPRVLAQRAAFVGAPTPALGGLTVAEVLEWERRSLAARHVGPGRVRAPRSVGESLALAEATHLACVRTRLLAPAAARRVAVARALLASPHLLVLDEPHAGAAPGEWRELARTLAALADRGLALLASARDPASLGALPSRVVRLAAAPDARRDPAATGRARPRPRGGEGQGAAAWRCVAEPTPGA